MAVEVVMPRLSDSMEDATVVTWLVAEGDPVHRGQPLAEIETDTAVVTFEAETDGVLLRIVCEAGESVSLGTTIAVIGEEGEAAPDGLPRRAANTLGIDLSPIGDLAPVSAPTETARGTVDVTQLSRGQKTVARRMAESRATVPDFELRIEVDMSAAGEMRESLRALGADPLPSFNDMIVEAAARCLREFPRVNGAYRDGTLETYSRVNVGVAVAADDALVVPVVTDADSRTLGDVARVTRELAGKVRDGTVTPPELAGGTFTVSNLGMFGIDSFSAVINVPQAAILAVGSLAKRAVAGPNDQVVVRPTLTLTLTCDHRVLYGADGARFLSRLRDLLEQPVSFAL